MPLDFAQAHYEATGPSLLAAEPPTLPTLDAQAGSDWGEIFQRLESRLNSLRNWRWSWWATWSALAQWLRPERYHFVIAPNQFLKGLWLNEEIIDSTATLSMQVCAAGMWTGLTSPTRPWFKLGVGLPGIELDEDAEKWLEDSQETVYQVLAESNFYNTMAQAFEDVATFGTAPVIIYEDRADVIRCYLPCAGEYFLAVGSRMSVDTLYREFVMTVYAIVEMFGLEACPAEVRQGWREGGASWDREFVVAHAIEPNTALPGRAEGAKPIRVVPASFPWREVYWLRGHRTPAELSRRGFHEAPFFAARWSTVSNNPYGRGPGWYALGDTKQLQLETIRKAEYLEKGVRPPMGGSPELKNEPSSIRPGHLTYVSTEGGKKGFWPLFEISAQWLPGITQDIETVAKRIERCFFVDLFQAITRMEGVQPRNELEITQRDLERLQTLGPFVNLWTTECAAPALMRVIGICARRGILRSKPASLRGLPLGLSFVSMMKLAQRAAETATMERTAAFAGNLSAAAKASGVPDPIRTLDLDKFLKDYAEHVSFPDTIFYTSEEVQQHDKMREQMAQQQQLMQASLPAVQAAKTLSETSVGAGQNALGAMLGAGGGAPQ